MFSSSYVFSVKDLRKEKFEMFCHWSIEHSLLVGKDLVLMESLTEWKNGIIRRRNRRSRAEEDYLPKGVLQLERRKDRRWKDAVIAVFTLVNAVTYC